MQKKILIIDKDFALYKTIRKKFSDSINVSIANSSATGITKAFQWMPDLIILEIMIPSNQNEFDVLRQLKRRKKTKNIPVIVYTWLEGEKKTVIEEGAIDYLVKLNIDPDNIAERIDQYFKSIT